jgi:hypothetical protein
MQRLHGAVLHRRDLPPTCYFLQSDVQAKHRPTGPLLAKYDPWDCKAL